MRKRYEIETSGTRVDLLHLEVLLDNRDLLTDIRDILKKEKPKQRRRKKAPKQGGKDNG